MPSFVALIEGLPTPWCCRAYFQLKITKMFLRPKTFWIFLWRRAKKPGQQVTIPFPFPFLSIMHPGILSIKISPIIHGFSGKLTKGVFLEGKDLIGDILIFHWTRSMGGRVALATWWWWSSWFVHLTKGNVKTWDLYQDERNDNREQ